MTDLFVIEPTPSKTRRHQRLWWLPAAITLLLAFMPASYVACRQAQLNAFNSAPNCSRVDSGDCWYGLFATVERIDYSDGSTAYLDVTAYPPADRPIRFEESTPLLDEVNLGDQVFVEVWHGQVWRVRFGDTAEYTSTAVRFIAGSVLATLALLAFAVVALIRPLWRRGRLRPARSGFLTFGFSTAILFALIAPVTLIGTNPGTLPIIIWSLVAVAFGIGLIVLVVRWWWWRRYPLPEPGHTTGSAAIRLSAPRRRANQMVRRIGWTAAFVAIVAGTIGALVAYPLIQTHLDAYSSAPLCPPDQWRSDCRETSRDYVVSTDITYGRQAGQSIDLGIGGWVAMTGSARSFVRTLHRDDPVVVERWQGKIIKAGYPAPSFQTEDNPAYELRLAEAFGLVGLCANLIVFSWIRWRRTGLADIAPRWWWIDASLGVMVMAAGTLMVMHERIGAAVGAGALLSMAVAACAPVSWVDRATGRRDSAGARTA